MCWSVLWCITWLLYEVYTRICMCIYIYIYTYIYIHACIHIYMHTHIIIHLSLSIHIYIYIYICICIYIYIYIERERERARALQTHGTRQNHRRVASKLCCYLLCHSKSASQSVVNSSTSAPRRLCMHLLKPCQNNKLCFRCSICSAWYQHLGCQVQAGAWQPAPGGPRALRWFLSSRQAQSAKRVRTYILSNAPCAYCH